METIVELTCMALLIGMVIYFPLKDYLDEQLEGRCRFNDGSMEQNNYEKHSQKITNSYNNNFNYDIGTLIVHPTAIKELGEAGAKILDAGSVFYDRERGTFALEGKTAGEISSPENKQLLPHFLKEERKGSRHDR